MKELWARIQNIMEEHQQPIMNGTEREIRYAESVGALRAAVESTCRAIDRNSEVLERHIHESQGEFRSLRDHFDGEVGVIKDRISTLESLRKTDIAQREQLTKVAKVLYFAFGSITAALIWAADWIHSLLDAAKSIKTHSIFIFLAASGLATLVAKALLAS